MSQTISELEKERAELLKAIQSQAKNISSNRSTDSDLEGHTLKDWLNAAEDVMPNKARSNSQAPQSTPASSTKSPMGKASFFGVIILLSLLLTILGVLYLAYSTVDRELKEVKEVKLHSQEESIQLQASMNVLEQTVATGGSPERFVELEQRVMELEIQLEMIQKQQLALLARLENGTLTVASGSDEVFDNNQGQGSNKLLTESVLDEKLQAYTSGLERRIDEKLSMILEFLTKGEIKPELKEQVLLNGKNQSKNSIEQDPVEPEITEPTISEPATPKIKQPLLKMVEVVKAPIQPKVSNPIVSDQDIVWLLEQPEQHYVLQLASMTDKQALLNMVKQKGLKDSRIVVQTRDTAERYVLVHGSYANRNDANQKAKEIKTQFGIAPWVRKMKDLTSKLP